MKKQGFGRKLIEKMKKNRARSKDIYQQKELFEGIIPQTLTVSVKKAKNFQTVDGYLSIKLPEGIKTRRIRRIYKHYYNALLTEVNQGLEKINGPFEPNNDEVNEGIDFDG